MSFPYFLYKSLAKMPRRVQKHPGNPYNSIYHHGLVKILIADEIHLRKDSWVNFVERIRGSPSSPNPHSPHILLSPYSEGLQLVFVPDPEPEPPLIELFSYVLQKSKKRRPQLKIPNVIESPMQHQTTRSMSK